MKAQQTVLEAARYRLIHELSLTGGVRIAGLDYIVRLAAHATDSAVALVTIVGEDRQWIPASVGWAESFTELVDAFCHRAVEGTALLEVRQAHLDERFRASRLVTGPSAIRFYAGHPIIVESVPLGTVCVLDQKSRSLTEAERGALSDLASVTSQLLMKRTLDARAERATGASNCESA